MEKPATSILAVDDEETLLHLLTHVLKRQGYYVDTAPDGRTAITMLQTLPFDLVFLDIMMPDVSGIEVLKFIKGQHLDTEVIMLTAVHDVKTAVECMSLGAYYYITKPYTATDLPALVERALERKRLLIQNKALRHQIAYRALPSSMVGKDKALLAMLDLALRAAPTESTVLIQGASGTGKEVVANFIHANSLRKDQPSLALNCSSMPATQLESELFGHEKEAFADAKNAKQGLLEIADGGTLFLDEIGEMPLSVQPKLLWFVQTGEFHRTGSSKNLKSDVRIISATNRDLRREVTSGKFREDLLLRLNVITLQLPALRERKDDIPLLAEQFLKDYAGMKQPKHLDVKALELLMSYDWPGNTRELENVIRRAAVLSEDDVICVDHLALPSRSRRSRKSTSGIRSKGTRIGTSISLAELQKVHVQSVLASVNWNKLRAAKILGIDLKALSGKIKTYKLSKTK